LEFSFDRSRNTNSNTSNSTQQSTSAAGSAGGATDEVDTSQIANERLRKAIERNRARQRDREAQASPRTNPAASSAWAQHQAHANMSNPREMEPARETTREPVRESYREQPAREAIREHVHAHENVHQRAERPVQTEHVQESFFEQKSPPSRPEVARGAEAQAQTQTAVNSEEVITTRTPSRRSVARPEDTEFAPTVKRTSKRAAAQISYTTGTKKKGKELDPKLVDYLVKGTWLFCGFLVLRLIFASGGVTDYFSQKSILSDRLSELSRIKNENMGLVSEIERMQLDAGYQKKLVRDNLGFIAPDEYLVLFPKD